MFNRNGFEDREGFGILARFVEAGIAAGRQTINMLNHLANELGINALFAIRRFAHFSCNYQIKNVELLVTDLQSAGSILLEANTIRIQDNHANALRGNHAGDLVCRLVDDNGGTTLCSGR
ncbi:hypothetical protein EFK68_04575 [Pseudomonas aeruginosa]|nr:hypothetical protein EFK68_04575 [Pseudomonas aeruginosa]